MDDAQIRECMESIRRRIARKYPYLDEQTQREIASDAHWHFLRLSRNPKHARRDPTQLVSWAVHESAHWFRGIGRPFGVKAKDAAERDYSAAHVSYPVDVLPR